MDTVPPAPVTYASTIILIFDCFNVNLLTTRGTKTYIASRFIRSESTRRGLLALQG